MLPVSPRSAVFLSLFAVLCWPAVASANHHHIGGSGSGGGDDPNADCLAWGYVVVDGGAADRGDATDGAAADVDAGVSDAGNGADAAQPVDAAANDGGSAPPAGAVLVCLEHATLFGCDCAVGSAGGAGWPRGAVASIAVILLAARRRRRTTSRGGTP